jgi:nitrate reductase NapD
MADDPGELHISSAVVFARPDFAAEVSGRIARMPQTEIYHEENGKFVVILEGASVGEIGARLAEIALFDGVISANLVYEHVEPLAGLEEAS